MLFVSQVSESESDMMSVLMFKYIHAFIIFQDCSEGVQGCSWSQLVWGEVIEDTTWRGR